MNRKFHKLKLRILTKKLSSVPQSQRRPKVEDEGEPKERGTTGTNVCVCERETRRIPT